MSEIRYITDDAICMASNGGCPYAAMNTIVNAIAMSEMDVLKDYQYAADRIKAMVADKDEDVQKCADIVCRMIIYITEDEGNHLASCMKAAAKLGGYKEPKSDEYNKAVKE